MDFNKKIFILTGEKNTGKSIVCEKILCELAGKPLKITGLLSPARYEGNRKTGIFCKDIISGEKKLLAQYKPGWDANNPKREWRFNQSAITWGNKVLAKSVPTGLLIIDELGYLELEEKSGWKNALYALDSGQFQFAIVVIRPSLIKIAFNLYPQAEIIEIASTADRGEALAYIINDIGEFLKDDRQQLQKPH